MRRLLDFRTWNGEKMTFMSKGQFGLTRIGTVQVPSQTGHESYDKDWPVMEFAGREDIKFQKVFEGDIVRISSEMIIPMEGFVGTVKFYESAFWIDNGKEAHPVWSDAYVIEVIGNIHQHPHLLNP